MIRSVSHIDLFVPNLQKAEQYYQTLFDMNLIGREVEIRKTPSNSRMLK